MFWELALQMVPDILKKACLALGLVWVSSVGVTHLFESALMSFQGLYGGIPVAMLTLAAMGGLPFAIGILLGAMAARLALASGSHLIKLAS